MPGIKGMTTFAVYAADFWDWGKSEYLWDRVKRRKLTVGYADKSKWVVESVLLPYFGKMRLDKITGERGTRANLPCVAFYCCPLFSRKSLMKQSSLKQQYQHQDRLMRLMQSSQALPVNLLRYFQFELESNQ